MATAKILGQTQKILTPSESMYDGSLSILYPFPTQPNPFGDDPIPSSVLTFEQSDASVSFFALVKQIFKEKQSVVITTYSPDDGSGTPLVDPTKTEVLFKADGTFSLYNPDFEILAKGESARVLITYAVNQAKGKMTVVREVAIDITGTNEAPVALDEENLSVMEDVLLTGQVIATDIDSDDDSASLIYTLISGAHIPGFTFNADGSYQLDANTLYQHLIEGESVNYTFSWQATDRHGAQSGIDQVSITITGTNDAPVAVVHEDIALDEGDFRSGQVVAIDIDGDDDSSTLTYVRVDGNTVPGLSFNADGSYTLDARIDAYARLAKGETAEYTFSWQALDRHGARSGIDEVKITVTGTNDLPVVAFSDLTGALTELSVPVGVLRETGTIAFSDANPDDIHTIASVVPSSGTVGSLHAGVTNDTTGSGSGGVITWNYSVAAADLEYLAKDESHHEQFTLTLDDGNGGLVDRVVDITVTGTNDAPVMTAHADISIAEDHILQGRVSADDIDSDDDGASLTYGRVDNHTIPGLTFNPDGSYTLDTTTAAYQALAEGETVEYGFRWKAQDRHGAQSGIDDVTLTVTGTNDAPTVASALTHYTLNLLEGASDIDHGAVLHIEEIVEADGKAGWNVRGNTLNINSDFYQQLYENDTTETFAFTYRIVDEHGASVTQTANFEIEGKALPTLLVATSAGPKVNTLLLTVTGTPFDTERLNLNFDDLPAGTIVLDTSLANVTAGIRGYSGTHTFQIVLPPDHDAAGELSVILTGDNGAQNVQYAEYIYDVSTTTDLLAFHSVDQNMWGDFAGTIGWHEYIPFVGDAPIVWNAQTEEWEETEGAYWRSGDFDLLDIDLGEEDIYTAALVVPQAALNFARAAQTLVLEELARAEAWEAGALDKYNHVYPVADAWLAYGVEKVAYDVAEGAYTVGVGVFNAARSVFNLAESAFVLLQNGYSSAYSAWYSANQAYLDSGWTDWFGTTWYDPIKGLAAAAAWTVQAAAWTALEVGRPVYNAALSVFNAAQNEFNKLGVLLDAAEADLQSAYNHALALEKAMHDAFYYTDRSWAGGDPVTLVDSTAAWGEWAVASAEVDALNLPGIGAVALANAAVWAAEESYALAYGILEDAITAAGLDFAARLQVQADLFAQIGLQVDFELDLGSVDTQVDYRLTSVTQYNQTTDMLDITPMMTNLTDGDTVAFSTISPNATFYAALLYDVGAELQMLIDGRLSALGVQIFDLSPGAEGIVIDTTISTNSWNDLLATIPEAYRPQLSYDVESGKLVLIDFDSTEGGPFEVPFIEQLTEDILSIELDFPTVETEGVATGFDPGYFQEGGWVNVNLSELTDTFLNLVNAKLDFSPELKELYGLPSLTESTSLDAAIASMATGLMDQIWDILDDGQSEGIPIFLLDATDESSSSLLHVNLFADDLSTITPDTGSLGFYASYGESDPIIKVNIDIDAAVAVIVNKVVEAILAAVSAGASSGATTAIPDFNPLNISFGIDEVLEMVQVDQVTRDEIAKYIDLGFTFEAADLDTYASADFSQEFTLSIDDMSYALTMEDGSVHTFSANEEGNLVIHDASTYDINDDGMVDYTLSIVPTAMFSNDTEIGLSLGYVLDFLKGEFAAGVKLPLGELLGLSGEGWPDIELPMINIGVGPMLRVQGDLDVLSVDVYEDRFALDIGADTFSGGVDIALVGVNTLSDNGVAA